MTVIKSLIPVLLLAGALAAQSPVTPAPPAPVSNAYRSRLLGVFDAQTGEPIEGAEVMDILEKSSALTTKTGTVSLIFLPEGGTLVRIRKVGYEPTTMMVAISPADTVPMTVLLNSSAQKLPTVVTKDSAQKYISPGLRAFEERRKSGMGGNFISEAELRKNDSRTTMTNMIRRLPGLQVFCPKYPSRRAGECYATAVRSKSKYAILGGDCEVDVYVNGSTYMDNDLQKMKVEEFAGVEYYAGAAVPAQYNRTGSTCGVMLLWLRER